MKPRQPCLGEKFRSSDKKLDLHFRQIADPCFSLEFSSFSRKTKYKSGTFSLIDIVCPCMGNEFKNSGGKK